MPPLHTRYIMLCLFGAAWVQGAGHFVLQRGLERIAEGVVPAWLGPLQAISLFVPLAAQLMYEHLRQRRAWIALTVLSLLLGIFGWQQFNSVPPRDAAITLSYTSLVLYLWWSLALPFVQSWLQTGQWWPRYRDLFLIAWRNHLLLAQAALFCGLFWALLMLAIALFGFIGFSLPRRLVLSPAFASFATPLAFAAGLYLSAYSPQRTAMLLELVIKPLKWLALLTGAILLAFTPLLLLKLPTMLGNGERIISAYALLALAAASVVFINAAFRDGRSDTVFPRPIALALRAVMPLMLIISVVSLYAMYLRIDAHGLTVLRVWGMLAASTAVLYGIGYTIAAIRPGPWMAGIAPSNTVIAMVVIVILGLMYTPLLSPQRLTADSQFARVLHTTLEDPDSIRSPLATLAYASGRYGRQKLQALADLQDHPHAQQIRQLAADALAGPPLPETALARTLTQLEQLPIHPHGRTLTETERAQIGQDLLDGAFRLHTGAHLHGGVFIDLNADDQPEFILLHDRGALLFEHTDTGWRSAEMLYPSGKLPSPQAVAQALERGEVRLRRPRWFGIELGDVALAPAFTESIRAAPADAPATDDPPADHQDIAPTP